MTLTTRTQRCLTPLLCLVMAWLMLAGCSTPLVPPAEEPSVDRDELSDVGLMEQLRSDWAMLSRSDLSESERREALTRYNDRLLLLLRRLRHDLLHHDANARFYLSHLEARDEAQGKPLAEVYEDIVPAADVSFSELREHYKICALGVPLVGIIPADRAQRLPGRVPVKASGTVNMLTAVLEFPRDAKAMPVMRLYPRNDRESLRVGRVNYRLSADFSAGLEIYWNLTRLKEWRFLGLLRPQELRDVTGLSCMETYDPDKIPVILTHGLMSSAATFSNLVNRLMCDPDIRRHYQFWYYNYPTGVAWTITAARLRRDLRHTREVLDPHHRNKNWDRLVLIGHSMGGLITHYNQCEQPWLILRDASKATQRDITPYLNARYVTQPFKQPEFEQLRRIFFFEPIKAGLVIYLATPHRGSPIADYGVVTFLRNLVRLPENLITELVGIATLQQNTLLTNPEKVKSWFTSVGQLSPDSWSIQGLQLLRVRPTRICSVIGWDKGKTLERSSDGVVPYWSSHLPGREEFIVESSHSVQDEKETARIIVRTLRSYLRSCGVRMPAA